MKVGKIFRKEIYTLIFFVTARCQLRCKHCFYTKELDKKRGKNSGELTLGEIEKIADNLPYLESIQFSGGEPFLRRDLPEILKVFSDRGVKQFGIPTNGLATSLIVSQAKRIKKLGVKNVSISISLDGFREVHDKIRGAKCWDSALETFAKLKEVGMRTGFCFSLSKINYDSAIEFLNFIRKKKPDYILISVVRAKPSIMLGPKEFEKIKCQLEEIIAEYDTPFYRKRQKILDNIYLKILGGGSLPFKCLAGKIIAVLEPDGFVRSCEIRPKIANVRDYNYDIGEVLKIEKPNHDYCRGCIHSCFIGPSMSYSPLWMVKNFLGIEK